MTRRKRTPSPDRSRKRVAFAIPASLQQLSTLSRSLAIQNGANQEREASNIVARAQALSQSPTEQGLAGGQQQSRGFRFKHDERQFPSQQNWPQPMSNPGAIGHARFLGKTYGSQQPPLAMPRPPPDQAVENMRRAQIVHQQMKENRRMAQAQTTNPAAIPSSAPVKETTTANTLEDAQTEFRATDFDSKYQRDFLQDQQWAAPKSHKRVSTPQVKPLHDMPIEQRRQAIIAKLMKRNPASVAMSSSNIQIPTNNMDQESDAPGEPSTESDEPLVMTTQTSQIAALIARKKAENAANGTLNRWLAARAGQQALQGQAKPQSASAPRSVEGQYVVPTAPENPFIFQPHPSNLAQGLTNAANPSRGDGSLGVPNDGDQASDLRSLFSSPAVSPQPTPSQQRPTQIARDDEPDDPKYLPGQLPSPSLSSTSHQLEDEGPSAPSPSAQLLMNLANAAPTSSSQASQYAAMRAPSLSVSTEGLIRTSSAAQPRRTASRTSNSFDSNTAAYRDNTQLIQQQTERQQQQEQMRQYQQMQQVAQATYPRPTSQSPMPQRPQSSSNVSSNSAYYKVRNIWDGMNTNSFAMSPPTYNQNLRTNPSMLRSSSSASSAEYAMSGLNALSNADMYPGSRASGGGGGGGYQYADGSGSAGTGGAYRRT